MSGLSDRYQPGHVRHSPVMDFSHVLERTTADAEPLFGVASLLFVDYVHYRRQELLKLCDFSFHDGQRWIYLNAVWTREDAVCYPFGKGLVQIFPIKYESVATLNGVPVTGLLDAGTHIRVASSRHF